MQAYLSSMERQTRAIAEELGEAGFASMAIGGGTPTYLDAGALESVFEVVERVLGAVPSDMPVSVETSPETADEERLRVLAAHGVDRISMGVQSLLESETNALGRPQRKADVYRAIETIRQLGFSTLNIDMIYGTPGQTPSAWRHSMDEILKVAPEEIFLYPLYVRPQTGLARIDVDPVTERIELYRVSRDLLLDAGYRQISMRCFRRRDAPQTKADYACQEDGMVGLGCGARSYTSELHYACRFAVNQPAVRLVLDEWIRASTDDYRYATHGFRMNDRERRHRFVILSLLQVDGLDLDGYELRFGEAAEVAFPILQKLVEMELVTCVQQRLMLTETGMELSDSIGPALYSSSVRSALEEFVKR